MTRARFFCCIAPVLLAVAIVGGAAAAGQAQEREADLAPSDTPFIYEGRLIFGGEPVSGSADFRFLLFDDPAGGERHGPVLEWPDGALHRGWFEVELDFGVDLHDGTPRWLEVQVRAPAGEGDFEPLRPRQAVLPMLAARQSILNLDGEPRVFGEDANEPRTGADPADPRFADTLPGGFGDDPIGPPPGGGRPDGDRGAHPAGGGGPRQSLWVMTGQHIRNANSGNVGVGATSVNPRHRLHVVTGGHGHAAIHAWSGGTGNTIGIRGSVNSHGGVGVRGQNFATSGLAWGVHGITNSSQGRAIEGRSNHSSGYAGYFVGGRNYFEGNVSIGTTTASDRLTVRSSGLDTLRLIGPSGSGANSRINFGTENNAYIQEHAPGELRIHGNLGHHLTVGSSGIADIMLSDGITQINNNFLEMHAQTQAELGASQMVLIRGYQGEVRLESTWIHLDGSVGIGTTNPGYRLELPNSSSSAGRGRANAWHTYSSGRWKEAVQPIESALAKTLRLRGVMFTWSETSMAEPDQDASDSVLDRTRQKADPSEPVRDIGFIAEEVGAVIPELVSWEPDDSGYAQGMDYSKISALLVEAIRELKEEKDTEIKILRRENKELQERLARLERIFGFDSDDRQ